MSKPEKAVDKNRLTDEECDFILQRVIWKLRETVNPIDFFRGMGRAVEFGVTENNQTNARNMVRWFAKAADKG